MHVILHTLDSAPFDAITALQRHYSSYASLLTNPAPTKQHNFLLCRKDKDLKELRNSLLLINCSPGVFVHLTPCK